MKTRMTERSKENGETKMKSKRSLQMAKVVGAGSG